MSTQIVHAGIDSRPPAFEWQPALRDPLIPEQPPLDLLPPGVYVGRAPAAWMAEAPPDLPDARQWAPILARLVLEAAHGLRPYAQLVRWVDESIVAAIARHRRERDRAEPLVEPMRPPVVRSVHVQYPAAATAEIAAHLVMRERSVAMALRLEMRDGSWLCTAVELGPRPERSSARPAPRQPRPAGPRLTP